MYFQLYVVDTEMATDNRSRNQANNKCEYVVLHKLDKIIRAINHYSSAYKNMNGIVHKSECRVKSIVDFNMVLIEI